MIKVTFEFATAEEAAVFLAGKAVVPKSAAPAAPAPPTATPAAAPETPASSQPSKALAYDTDIAPKIAMLVKKNRDATVALLAEFGVKKGPELKAEDWPVVLVKVDALLAG